MTPEQVKPLGPLHQAGVLRRERQPPCVETGGDHGARRLERGQALRHHDQVIGMPGAPGSWPPRWGQAIAGNLCQPWADDAALGGAFRRVVPWALFPLASLPPWFEQLPPGYRAEAGQDAGLAARVKSPGDIGVQAAAVVAYSTIIERHVTLLEGILAPASGAPAGALRFALRFAPRLQGVVDHPWQHPGTSRREATRPWLPGGLRDLDAPDREGFPGLILTERSDQLGPLLGCGPPCPVEPWRRPSTGDLREAPDRHQHRGVTA
jgi:hypothetical protein